MALIAPSRSFSPEQLRELRGALQAQNLLPECNAATRVVDLDRRCSATRELELPLPPLALMPRRASEGPLEELLARAAATRSSPLTSAERYTCTVGGKKHTLIR